MRAATINEHVSLLLPSVRPIYKALRSMARKKMPGAYEMLYHNAIGYSLSESPMDRICYIAHQPKDTSISDFSLELIYLIQQD